MAAVNFISSETKLDVNLKEIELSRLFLWYKTDFIGIDLTDENKKLLE
jgi:hypothetical protein